MIRDFERETQKPTNNLLDQISISATATVDRHQEQLATSLFKAGEWLAELLCLIPIQIAVTKENQFAPLKDGVDNEALERRLLGADVGTIIESISLGWYESIFSSYMANKPVKVISSMG